MISVVYSTEHLLMPKIIGTLLVIMLAVIVLVEGRERKAATGKFFGSFGPFFREMRISRNFSARCSYSLATFLLLKRLALRLPALFLYSSSMYFIQVGVKRHFERVL